MSKTIDDMLTKRDASDVNLVIAAKEELSLLFAGIDRARSGAGVQARDEQYSGKVPE